MSFGTFRTDRYETNLSSLPFLDPDFRVSPSAIENAADVAVRGVEDDSCDELAKTICAEARRRSIEVMVEASAEARRQSLQEFVAHHRERRKSAALVFAALLVSVLTGLSVCAGQYQLLAPILGIVALVVGCIFHEPANQEQSAER